MKPHRTLSLMAVVALVITTVCVWPPVAEPQQVPQAAVSIGNHAKVALSFQLRDEQGSWRPEKLAAGATRLFNDAVAIKIATQGKGARSYKLEAEPRRFYLDWNKKKGCWDVYKLRPK